MMVELMVRIQLALMKTSNTQKPTVANKPSAEQCGRFSEAGIHQTYNG